LKKTGGGIGAIIGKGGSKFGGLDIKRVYFGYVIYYWPFPVLTSVSGTGFVTTVRSVPQP
jgi:hypothetical protein